MRKGPAPGASLQPRLAVALLVMAGFLLIAVWVPREDNASGSVVGTANKARRPLTATWLARLALALPAAAQPHEEAAGWGQGMQDMARSLRHLGSQPVVSRQGQQQQQQQASVLQSQFKRRRLRCAVFSSVRFHADVAAGLLWAFQEAGCLVTAYLHPVAWQSMKTVVLPWFKGTRRPHTDMLAEAGQYDALVLATFPEPKFAGTQAALLLGQHRPPPHQRLLLVTHNPDRLLTSCAVGSQEWLLDLLAERAGVRQRARKHAPRLQLLTLAPCVANFTAAMLAGWAAERQHGSGSQGRGTGRGSSVWPEAEVPWMAPLVPWQGKQAGHARHLCIQGSIDPRRRDYAGAFAAASHPAVLAQMRACNESLVLVGSGSGAGLKVPPSLRPHVRILANLPYEAYYATLSSCRAILTALGSDVYIVKKASSTLAAALQVGTPLVTEDSVLAAYSYILPAAVYSYRRSAASGQTPQPAAFGAAAGREAAADPTGRCSRLGSATAMQGSAHFMQRHKLMAAEEHRSNARPAEGLGAALAQPPPGSYAAALLAAFDDGANQAAHEAALRAKQEVMLHNVQVATRVVTATAAAAAAI